MRRLVLIWALAGCAADDGGMNGTCGDVSGTWEVSGCGDDECVITQTGCSASLSCEGGSISYTGSVAGNQLSFQGRSGAGVPATCQATVQGAQMSGSCSPQGLPTCSFTAARQ
jgi:hypothetical protein